MVNEGVKVRREIPHEPGEWMEFRPLTVQMTIESARNRADGDKLDAGLRSLVNGVVGWSYAEECVEANIRRLDIGTANWAMETVQEISHISALRGEASAASSNGTTSATAAIPKS